jgi:hypothetical protein
MDMATARADSRVTELLHLLAHARAGELLEPLGRAVRLALDSAHRQSSCA